MKLSAEQQSRGRLNTILTSLFSMIFFYSISATILNLFAVSIGMAPDTIGLVNSFLSLFAVTQLFLIDAIEIFGKRRYVMLYYSLQSAFALLFVLAPVVYIHFGAVAAGRTLLLAAASTALFGNLGQTGWFSLIRDSVPDEMTGRFFARLRTIWQIACTLFLIGAGIYLGSEPSMNRFGAVFAVGLVAAIIRQFFMFRIPEEPPRPEAGGIGIWRAMAAPIADANFRRFLLFTGVIYFAIGFASPFIVVYMKSGLGLPASLTTIIAAMETVGSVISVMLWGRLADKFGHRSVYGLSVLIYLLAMFFWLQLGSLPLVAILMPALLSSLLRGMSVAGIDLAMVSFSIKSAPRRNGAAYIVTPFIVSGLAGGLGPIAAGKMLLLLQQSDILSGVAGDPYRLIFLIDVLLAGLAIYLKKRIDWQGDLPSMETVRQTVTLAGDRLAARISGPRQEKKPFE